MSEPTPRPWKVAAVNPHGKASNRRWIITPGVAVTKTAADAEQIVRSVNAHDEMVAALNDAKDYCVAMEGQAPGPFNQTPLSQIVAALGQLLEIEGKPPGDGPDHPGKKEKALNSE